MSRPYILALPEENEKSINAENSIKIPFYLDEAEFLRRCKWYYRSTRPDDEGFDIYGGDDEDGYTQKA